MRHTSLVIRHIAERGVFSSPRDGSTVTVRFPSYLLLLVYNICKTGISKCRI